VFDTALRLSQDLQGFSAQPSGAEIAIIWRLSDLEQAISLGPLYQIPTENPIETATVADYMFEELLGSISLPPASQHR